MVAETPKRSGRAPQLVVQRATARAEADGLATVTDVIVELLRVYGTGHLRVTAWPAHELAAVLAERIAIVDTFLERHNGVLFTAARARQLLADVEPRLLADQFETSPDDGAMSDTSVSYRCPHDVWDRADARRPGDGFRNMNKLVTALLTRYAAGGIDLARPLLSARCD